MTHIWTQQVSGVSVHLRSVWEENGVWIAVGDDGTIITSFDNGVTWLSRTSGVTNSLRTVKYWNGDWYIVGRSLGGSTAAVVLKSSDSVTWTDISSSVTSTNDELVDIAFNDTTICFLGWETSGFTAILYKSTDGITFTSPGTLGTAQFGYGIAWNETDSLWGVVGSVSGNQWFGTSSDLITWTKKTVTGATGEIWTITYDGSNWVVAENLTKIYTSPDSTTWTYRPESNMGSDNPWRLTHNSTGTLLLSGGFTAGKIIESTDGGATWTLTYSAGTGTPLMSRTEYGGDTWVGVGWNGNVVTGALPAPFDASSWYHAQGQLHSPEIIRRFIVGSDDYSDRVSKWPKIKSEHNRVRPGKVTIELANHDQVLNSFRTDKTNMTKPCILQFGYAAIGRFKLGQVVTATYSTVIPDTGFGYSMSLSRDGQKLAIGNPGDSGTDTKAGNAFVYSRHATRGQDYRRDKWLLSSSVHINNTSSGDYSGYDVAMDTDEFIFIEGRKIGSGGTIVVNKLVTGTTSYANYDNIIPDSEYAGALFGVSVSVSSGAQRICVGASNHLTTSADGNVGAAYIFDANLSANSFWGQSVKLDASSSVPFFGQSSGDLFGIAVAISGDGNRACVAAPNTAPATDWDRGAAFIYTRSSNNNWDLTDTLGGMAISKNLGRGEATLVGNSTIGMNYDGSVVAIGAPHVAVFVDADVNSYAGKVFIWVESSNGRFTQATPNVELQSNNVETKRFFGSSVFMSNSADILVIGEDARWDNSYGGDAHVYRRSAVTSPSYELLQTINPTNSHGILNFGNDISMDESGHTLAIGAFSRGEIYMYYANSDATLDIDSYQAEEVVDIYQGTIDRVALTRRNTARFSIQDRMKVLKERYMGTEDSPVVFSNDVLPGDIFWTAITCYGGLSSIESTSNPDIDYQSWLDWHTRMRDDSLFMGASFKGVRVIEVLSKLARMTDSSITVERNKIYPRRWSHAESITQDFNLSNAYMDIGMEATDMINNQTVVGDYSVESRAFQVEINVEDLPSVNSFGIREHLEKDTSLWFVSSNSCKNMGQRKVVFNKEPIERIILDTYLPGLTRHVGDTISTTNSAFDHDTFISRVTGHFVDMDQGEVGITATPSILLAGFVLDVDSLDITTKFLT